MVETILVLALIALLTSCLMTVYWAASNSFARYTGVSEIQYTVREVRQLMLKDLYSSEKAEVLSLDGNLADPGEIGPRLRLIIPVRQEASVEYRAVYYYIENGKLYRERIMLHDKYDSADDQFLDKIPVADHITAIRFSASMSGVIEYEIKCSYDRNTFGITGRASSKVDYGI
ncbi:hypothetical protein ASZ90_017533 [hydrocarbon metagenome]|uniref:Uncharacterized protein n=1 Tax=hydrocarbon metagenome TaxID=938273 RepID=A0A0W8E8T8_9ZZZZ